MKQCANSLIFTCLALTSFSSAAESENKAQYLDPRFVVPFTHFFYTPGFSNLIALRFINDIMRSETPKLCDTIVYKNTTKHNESSAFFDILCLKSGYNSPVAKIGIQPVRFESTTREITQFEVADHYFRQLHGLDWKQRISEYKNLIPVLSILVSQFEPGRIDRLLKHSKMLDTWSHENLYTGFGISSLYLDKCRERVRKDGDIINDLDKWCHFFLFAGSYQVGEVPAWAKTDDVMKLAYFALNPRSYTEVELRIHSKTMRAAEQDYAGYKKAVENGTWKGGPLK